MKRRFEFVTLDSGKKIQRSFDEHGQITDEIQSYGAIGALDIAIRTMSECGKTTDEMYFINRRLVSRKRYEKERAKYSDMPPADQTIHDSNADLLRAAARERRAHNEGAKAHTPNPASASNLNSFCLDLMKAGHSAEVQDWIQSKQHTLGEMSWEQSRKLVEKLKRLGAVAVHACQIDVYPDGIENTGHLVVELPADPSRRKSLVKEVDRLAREQGHEGDFDDGQRYAYAKLD